MSSETNNIRIISSGKSKKMKLDNKKNIKGHSDPQSVGKLDWINHEIIIDDEHEEEECRKSSLKSEKTTRIRRKIIQLALPPIISDHDYTYNSKATNTGLITLRKDLFCDESEKQNLNVLINSIETSNKSVLSSSRVTPSKKDIFETDSKLKFETKLVATEVDPVNLSDNSMKGSIDLTKTSKVSEHSSHSKLPVVLKKVDSKSVPPEIKARTLLKSNMNLPSNCTVSQVILKHNHPPLKVISSKILLNENKEELNRKIKSNVKLIHMKKNFKTSFEETCSSHKNHSLNEKKNKETIGNKIVMESDILEKDLLGRKDSTQVIEKIKNSVNNQKIITVSNYNQNPCEDDILNIKVNHQLDSSEVRLSSLADVSQVAIECGTTQSSEVLKDENKASTSNNIAGINNIDLMKDDSDEDTDEELGLNSLEELEQFWEFLVELHDYNKQVIRSQQNKKRRYLSKINKLEDDLQQNFGIELEKFEEENDESSDGNMKEITSKAEEKNEIVRQIKSMEEE